MADLRLPPTRIAIGAATVGGQRVDLLLSPEWARYFDSLNTQVVVTSNAVGLPGAPGTTGAAGFGMCMEGEGGSDDLIPGPAGPAGAQGVPGAALFLLLGEPEAPEAILPATQLTEAFIAPTLLNGWSNFGSGFNPAGYCKDAHGVVHLRGLLTGGTVTTGTSLLSLPAGYWPTNTEIFAVSSNSAFGEVRVSPTGSVTIQAGSAAWLSLDGITFRVA